MKKTIALILLFFPIGLLAQLTANFTQLNIGCSSKCDGIIKVEVSGGAEPYSFDWKGAENDPDDHSIAIKLCGGKYNITITDANGIKLDTSYIVDVMKAPKLTIKTFPGDTVYIQKPDVQFSFENSEEDTNPVTEWLWNFGDNNTTDIKAPVHTYSAVNNYFASLKIKYAENCDTTFAHQVKVKSVKLFIPNVITPNGDGINDKLIITSQESKNSSSIDASYSLINDFYISNELVILNRWGQEVYKSSNYLNDWGGDNLSDGVYFYILKCHGKFEDDIFKGSISILGSNK